MEIMKSTPFKPKMSAAKESGVYESRGKGRNRIARHSRPIPRRWSTNKYDARIVGAKQSMRDQSILGMRNVTHRNGFTTMETDL